VILGEDIRLRALEREDVPRCAAWINDREVSQYLLVRSPMSLVAEEQWYDRMAQQAPNEQVLAIDVLMDQAWRHIGNISFHGLDIFNHSAEVGILIGERDCLGKGWGRKAMKLMLDYGFGMLNLHRIYLHVHADNERAIRSYRAVGFCQEGLLREDMYKYGRYVDVLVMSILRQEWEAQRSNE
jgi:RimJ/RimL family protein N-acetyltransferase